MYFYVKYSSIIYNKKYKYKKFMNNKNTKKCQYKNKIDNFRWNGSFFQFLQCCKMKNIYKDAKITL